jgi:deazaflavin-dependent oxidoreductase (nitroreductase family)
MKRRTRRAIGGIGLAYLAVAVFERVGPRPLVRKFQNYVGDPLQRSAAGFVPRFAVIETIGRRTGLQRRVPVGGALRGGSFWFVAADPRRSSYIKNIEANPRMRVKVYGRWRRGTAALCPDDQARKRVFRLNPVNGLFLSIAGRDLMTVRVDLEHH